MQFARICYSKEEAFHRQDFSTEQMSRITCPPKIINSDQYTKKTFTLKTFANTDHLVEAVKNMPKPTADAEDPKKRLRSFLGMASYARKFILFAMHTDRVARIY